VLEGPVVAAYESDLFGEDRHGRRTWARRGRRTRARCGRRRDGRADPCESGVRERRVAADTAGAASAAVGHRVAATRGSQEGLQETDGVVEDGRAKLSHVGNPLC
jgi:hypothetical protein